MAVSREKLHEEVWAEPMTTVAKRYEVSSTYLARICERLNIPRPGRGYWQQRAVGAEVESDPLPEAQPGDEIEWARDGSRPAIAPMSWKRPRPPKTDVPRPDKHALLVGARGLFDEVRGGREVLYVVPLKRNLVDVFVTPSTLDRALKTASELFLYLEDRGQRVVLAPSRRGYVRADVDVREGAKGVTDYGEYERGCWQPATPTIALVGDVAIGVTIYETMEELDGVWRNGKRMRYEAPATLSQQRRGARFLHREHVSKQWFPTGRLGLHAYAAERVSWEQTWIEKASGDMPTLFEQIAKTFEEATPKIVKLLEERAQEEARRRKEAEEQHKRWRREEAELRRKEQEAAREKEILGAISKWRTARDVRAYVAEIHALVKEADVTINEGGRGDQELKWALSYADRIDPLTSWRKDIEKVKADAAGKPCPECGKVHGADEAEGEASPRTAPDPAQTAASKQPREA
jgi:hypothetical protein